MLFLYNSHIFSNQATESSFTYVIQFIMALLLVLWCKQCNYLTK
jgi:hypothetical protein